MMSDMTAEGLGEDELAEIAVRCLTLNLNGLKLLLPNTLVAEVTEASAVSAAGNTPDWIRGFVSWRGRTIPLVSFEQLLGMASSRRHGEARMVVLNTLNANPAVPFIAMEIQGLPHLSLLKHGMLEYEESKNSVEPVILSRLRVDGESVIVPNIDAIERMLVNLGISA